MGLDMFLYKTGKKFNTQKELEDYYKVEGEPDCQEIGYWRKHPDLHGIMEQMFEERTYHYRNSTFNLLPLLLTEDDLKMLYRKSKDFAEGRDEAETVEGFFFGTSYNEQWKESAEIFKDALESTDFKTQTIFYNSWW